MGYHAKNFRKTFNEQEKSTCYPYRAATTFLIR